VTLRDLMAQHARGVLTRPDHCGEPVTWHFASGAADRSFNAVVNRLMLEQLNSVGTVAAVVKAATVFVPNDSTLGVTSVADGDEISVALRLGAAPVRCRVAEVLSEDEGGFLVRCVQ
jgi:hypothetical protein